jgi:flagellar biogenesis protein FliO
LFRAIFAALASCRALLHAATPVAAAGGYLSDDLAKLDSTGPAAQAPSLLPTLLNVAFSLAFVVGLVYVAYWLLLKWRNRQGAPAGESKVGLIKVLEKHHIDGRHLVAAVELGDEVLFLGLGNEVTVLSRIQDPEAVERLKQMAPLPADFLGFKEQLARVGLKMKREEWGQAKQALHTQAEELKEQMERMRSRRGEGK